MMNPDTRPKSAVFARLIVASVALSSLAAGGVLVGSAIDSATDAPERIPQVSKNSSSVTA
jgi:hypothetical protein